jgi:chromosome segregation ATPase
MTTDPAKLPPNTTWKAEAIRRGELLQRQAEQLDRLAKQRAELREHLDQIAGDYAKATAERRESIDALGRLRVVTSERDQLMAERNALRQDVGRQSASRNALVDTLMIMQRERQIVRALADALTAALGPGGQIAVPEED